MTMLHARIDEAALRKLINGDTVVLDTNDLATGVAVILAEIGWDRIFDVATDALATKLRALPEDRHKALLQELWHAHYGAIRMITGGWAVAFDPKAKRCASMSWHDDGSVTVELWNETERCTVRITAQQAISVGEALIKGTTGIYEQ